MTLQQVASTWFIRLESEWSLVQGREMLDALTANTVIVQRHDPDRLHLLG